MLRRPRPSSPQRQDCRSCEEASQQYSSQLGHHATIHLRLYLVHDSHLLRMNNSSSSSLLLPISSRLPIGHCHSKIHHNASPIFVSPADSSFHAHYLRNPRRRTRTCAQTHSRQLLLHVFSTARRARLPQTERWIKRLHLWRPLLLL